MESKLIVGIDVSKDTLDVVYKNKKGELEHFVAKNDKEGHREIIKRVGKLCHFVMESSGPYYLNLALRLDIEGIHLTVANALRVKRFIQMKGERNKSDKKDAFMIYQYGLEQELELWKAPSDEQVKSRQLITTKTLYTKQRTMLLNRKHSVEHQPIQDKVQLRSLKRMIKNLDKEIAGLEQALEKLINAWAPEQYKNLQSIPGIGKKASMTLIVRTDAFSKVGHYKQLISLAGMAPTEFRSGTSVRGKVHICKMGGSDIRNHMYLSSMTAIRHNPTCKAMFERLKGRGKNGRVALIAVGNKLLKQCFAIATSGVPFDPNYQNEIVMN